MPAVFALPAAWIERGHGPDGEAVLTWAQAREMQQSGLVEFASHSYDLHGTVRGNPQASQVPAFWARVFDPARGYEDDDAYRHRVGADLQQSIAVMTRELGRAPRAIAWPYGRYTQSAVEIAQALGFRFALTFDPEPALASRPFALARFSLSSGSLLPPLVGAADRPATCCRAFGGSYAFGPHRCGGRIPQRPSACSARPSSASGSWAPPPS